jgi:two-component system OmpR family sensor kinase
MRWAGRFIVLLPAAAAVLFVVILAHLGLLELTISLNADLDVILILAGGALSIILGLVISIRTSTEYMRRRAIRQALNQIATDHVGFLHRLDHEIKNPLMAIRAALANLNDVDDAATRQAIRDTIEAQVLRLSLLSNNLRKIADLETHPLECIPLDPGDLLKEALAMASDNPACAERDLRVQIAESLPPLLADHDLLVVALYNVLDNAIKFSQPGDRILARAFEEGDRLIFQVEDNGPGIAPEDLPHIWENLFRGRDAHRVPGSGIGLGLVRSIIQRHDGTVTVASQPDAGTTVTIELRPHRSDL